MQCKGKILIKHYDFLSRLWPWAVRSWWRSLCWAGRRWSTRWWGTLLITASPSATWRISTHLAFTQVLINNSMWMCPSEGCSLFCGTVFSHLCCFARITSDCCLYFVVLNHSSPFCGGSEPEPVFPFCFWQLFQIYFVPRRGCKDVFDICLFLFF